MSSIPYPLDPMGSKLEPCFELTVQPGILGDSLTYGFTPYWNTGGYCKVVDWGDGSNEDAVTSGALITHTYAVAGTYIIRIKTDCYRVHFGAEPYRTLLYDSNGNWDALGNITTGKSMFSSCINAVFNFSELPKGITNADSMFDSCKKATFTFTSLPDGIINANYMFSGCSNAQLPLTSLPAGLTNGSYMFYNCTNATLPLTSLPDGITNANAMFSGCSNAQLPLTSLPDGITNANAMFSGCKKAVINLDDLTANAPEGGWTNITSIESMFRNAGSGNSPGTVTGSRSAFLAKFPNVTNTTNAFYGTNTTE